MTVPFGSSEFDSVQHTDLHTVLEHIEHIIMRSCHCVNATSGQMLSVAAAVECITLTQKLQRVLLRWQIYLPFRECYDVDFKEWEDRLTKIQKKLENGEHRFPDAPFRVDFADLIDDMPDTIEDDAGDDLEDDSIDDSDDELPIYQPRYGKSALRNDVEEYVERIKEEVERIRELSDKQDLRWRKRIERQALTILREQYTDYLRIIYTTRNQTVEEFNNKVLPKAERYQESMAYKNEMAYCLDMSLNALRDTLHQINELLGKEKSSEQLIRLSLRLFFRYSPDAENAAKQEVNKWAANWPKRHQQDRARQKRKEFVDRLETRFAKSGLSEYIDIGHPTPLDDIEFGHFLFANRQTISIADVKQLFHDIFHIQQLNRIINPIAAEADVKARMLSEDRLAIYNRLQQLVYQAQWLGGMTSERIFDVFVRVLLPQSTGEGSQSSSNTELFWNLLSHRRGCEEGFRSLKLTWLNLVGYFLSRGVLSGKGPALCDYFFPADSKDGDHDTDYNAVSKGAADRAGNNFHDLIGILDEMLEFQSSKSLTRANR